MTLNPSEGYDPINREPFSESIVNPLSTFSIDVADITMAAKYPSLSEQQPASPAEGAVRAGEMCANYVGMAYPQPATNHDPFSVNTWYIGRLPHPSWSNLFDRVGCGQEDTSLENLPPSKHHIPG